MFGRKGVTARGRVMLAITVVLAISLVALITVAYVVTARTLTNSIDRSLAEEAEAYSASLGGAPDKQSIVTATRAYLLGRTTSEAGFDPVLSVAFEDGRVLSNSELRLERAPDNTGLRAPSNQSTYGNFAFGGTRYRSLTVPIVEKGARVAVFQAALSTAETTAVARNVAFALSGAGLIALVVGILLSGWAATRSLAPLRGMAEKAKGISHASPSARMDYEGPDDELGSLAHSLDEMLARLQYAADEQRRFVADASHELRTPVAVIRGNSELILSDPDAGGDAIEAAAMIESESARMARLLDELLVLARLDSSPAHIFQPLHAPTMVEEAAARARTLGERRVEVSCADDAWVLGDPDQLQQVLLNIVRNAVAVTQPGGLVSLSCAIEGDAVKIAVRDDGPGFEEADLDRVFDRFYRSARRGGDGGGAGLGLAIARRLVERHGGAITAANVEGGGAAITIELPLAPTPDDVV